MVLTGCKPTSVNEKLKQIVLPPRKLVRIVQFWLFRNPICGFRLNVINNSIYFHFDSNGFSLWSDRGIEHMPICFLKFLFIHFVLFLDIWILKKLKPNRHDWIVFRIIIWVMQVCMTLVCRFWAPHKNKLKYQKCMPSKKKQSTENYWLQKMQ